MSTDTAQPTAGSPAHRPFGRRTLLTGLAGVAGAATVGLTAASAAAETVDRFGVAQFNIYSGLTFDQFRHDLDFILPKAGLIGLNEVQNRRDWFLNTWSGRSDWHVYAPAGWGAAETMLARRSRFDVLDRGSIFVCDTGGAGTPPPPRYLNWVTYKLKTTATVITHIHSHPNSHIDNAGHPYDLPRTVDAEKHFRMIRDLAVAKKADGQVVVTGDFNVDFVDDRRVQYEHFPYVVLDERDSAAALPGLRSCYAQFGVSATGTHGSRHIDYVYEWVKLPAYRRIWMTGYDVLAKQNSDHRPVVARFDVRR